MKRLLLLITIIANSILLNAQGFCLTGGGYTNQVPEGYNVSGTASLRVYFHIVTKGNFSIVQEDLCLGILNGDFIGEISFIKCGVDYIESSEFFNPASLKDDNIFRKLITTKAHSDGIDIYILNPDPFQKGYVRTSGIPGTALAIGGGNNNESLYDSHAISHAMGHCLGLFHTYHGTDKNDGEGCAEHANGDNSKTCGDYVWDTPADPHVTNCFGDTTAVDENGVNYCPARGVFMADTSPNCPYYFTPGQKKRMKHYIATSSVLQPVVYSSSIVYSRGGYVYEGIPENLYLRNHEYLFGFGYCKETAYYTIFAGPNIAIKKYGGVGNSCQEFKFEAGKMIVLKSDFRVEEGVCFIAKINPDLRPKYYAPERTPEFEIDDEISPIQETSDFSVSPNPAHNEITIHCSTPIEQVAIYNLNGQVVLQSTQTQIDLSALSQGVYIVRVLTTDGQVLQAKVLHE